MVVGIKLSKIKLKRNYENNVVYLGENSIELIKNVIIFKN